MDRASLPRCWPAAVTDASEGSELAHITQAGYLNSSPYIPAEMTEGLDREIMVLNCQKSPALAPKAFSDCLSLEICEFVF